LARRIREENQEIPIIFLTAKSTKEDKIHGLRLGADDYITKPFSIEELVLKIEVFLKRSHHGQKNNVITGECTIGDFIFDFKNHELKNSGKTHKLTHREAELLKMLYEHRDTIIKRDDILNEVWGDNHYFAGRSLDVFISRLRKYLSSDEKVKIENIHNVGYRLKTKE
jgi:DNA-binding response OmpR family regulator